MGRLEGTRKSTSSRAVHSGTKDLIIYKKKPSGISAPCVTRTFSDHEQKSHVGARDMCREDAWKSKTGRGKKKKKKVVQFILRDRKSNTFYSATLHSESKVNVQTLNALRNTDMPSLPD